MTKKIMVIDDDQAIRDSFIQVLSDEDFIVEDFKNGALALERLKNDPLSLPDLIILDLNMPVMDGLEFLKKSNQVGLEIPVVLLTASNSVIDVLELNRNIRIARKPIDLDLFINVVKELLKEKS